MEDIFKKIETPKSLIIFISQSLIIVIIGLLTGITIDKIVLYLQNKFNMNIYISVVIQITIIIISLWMLYIITYKYSNLVCNFQTTTPGLLFTCFFLIQFNLLNNLSMLYDRIDIKL